MTREILRIAMALCVATLLIGRGGNSWSASLEPSGTPDLGVDVTTLSHVIDHPYAGFSTLKRAVYEGKERDLETGEMVKKCVEVLVRDTAETVAGVKATVVEVRDYDDGELVGRTLVFYAQDPAGIVYNLGEKVDDLEGGKVVGHEGQWLAGENGARAGVFMPATLKVGAVFEQERAPGVAEDRSKVAAVGKSVKVRAGSYKDCIETEDYDPLEKTTVRKTYAKGIGLLRQTSEWLSLELVTREVR